MAGPTITTSDPYEYLKIAKSRLQDKRVYQTLREVLMAFNAKSIGINEVTSRVKELLKKDQELLLGFNAFLPDGYKITLEANQSPTMKEAIRFVDMVRNKFKEDNDAFKLFISIMLRFRSEEKSLSEVFDEVHVLFRDHPDLFQEFCSFLPRG